MSKLSNDEKGTIEISPNRVEKSPMPKVLVAPLVAVNVMALAVTSSPKVPLSNLSNDRVIIEQGKNTVLYPSKRWKYTNGQVIQDDDEIINNISSEKSGVTNKKITADITFQQIIRDLGKENAVLRNKLKNSLPVHTILYITGSSVVIAVSIVLLLLRFLGGIYIIDPYFIINALLIAITLLGTAITSLKDWKNFLNED